MGKGPGVGTNEESTTNGKKARLVLQSKEGRQRQRTEDSAANSGGQRGQLRRTAESQLRFHSKGGWSP